MATDSGAGLWNFDDLAGGTTRTCSACGKTLPLSDFYSRVNQRPNRRTERTYSYRCKECDKAATRSRHAYNADRADLVELPTEKRCRRCLIVRPAAEFSLNRTKGDGLQRTCKPCHRDVKYGLAPNQYDEMLAEQNGVCAICRRPCSRGTALSVDHCHATGRVRGLLCQNCNAALGMFQDDQDLLRRAIQYLMK